MHDKNNYSEADLLEERVNNLTSFKSEMVHYKSH